jgi:outer membrane protein assembly factor BamB
MKLSLPRAVAIMAVSSAILSSQVTRAEKTQQRPFRLGVIRMSPDLDTTKPLAESDAGGFVVRGDVLIGSLNHQWIRAYNLTTKKTIWWLASDGEITAPPLLVENTVYISTRAGKLTAFNATTGERLWETTLDAYIDRPMTWSNGYIYAVSAGQVAYSIEASSGKRMWVHDAGFPDMVVVRRHPAPIIHDGRMIVGLATGELVALKIEDGKRLWRYNPFYQDARFKDMIGEMVVHGGKLLLSRYDGLIALVDITQERQVIWQDRQTSVATSTFRAGRYYVGLTSGEVIAYDAPSGRISWRTQTGPTPAFIIASETALYVVAANGRLSSIEISSGQFNWSDNLGGRIATAPIVTGDRMYVVTGLRNIYAYKIH